MGTDYLDYAGVSAKTGISVGTLRRYLAEARANRAAGTPTDSDMPEPDEIFGRSPAWKPKTIDRWLRRRPGKGVGGAEARERYRREREAGER
jgi:predicted DNA-binding transcriptional regulator AlpA